MLVVGEQDADAQDFLILNKITHLNNTCFWSTFKWCQQGLCLCMCEDRLLVVSPSQTAHIVIITRVGKC